MLGSAANELIQLQRTPVPSPPAKDPITKIQIALNNLIGQLCESVFVIVEEAPQSRFNPEETTEEDLTRARELQERVIQTRAGHCASIIAAIRSLADQLPSSERGPKYYEDEIQSILRRSSWLTMQLEQQESLVEDLEVALRDQIRVLMNQVAAGEESII